MENIFLELVNLSIGASVAIVLVLILRFLLKKAPKYMFCLFWLIVGVKLVFPISIEVPVSIMPAQDIIKPNYLVLTVLDESIQSAEEMVQDGTVFDSGDAVFTEKTRSIDLTSFLTVIWVVGIVFLLTYSLVEYLRLRYTLRNSEDFDFGIKVSKNIKTPFVMGFIDPKIYIPNNIDESDLVHVIAHEKCHIRHKDHLLKPIAFLILSIHWFNPIVWIAYVFFCRDLELFCDESVIKKLGKEERRTYSKALLSCSTNNYISAVSPIAFGELCVKERVEKIMTYRKPSFWIVTLAVVSVIVTVVCVITGSSGSGSPVNGIYNYQMLPYLYGTYDKDNLIENLPDLKVSDGKFLSYRFNDYAEWNELGELEPVKLTKEDFDRLFPDTGVEKSMNSVKQTWENYTSSWVWKNVSEQYTDYIYLIYSKVGLDVDYAIVRIDNSSSTHVLTWLVTAHPSWNSRDLYSLKSKIESEILEKNKGRFDGDFACISSNVRYYTMNKDTEAMVFCTYLYSSYDIETMSSESCFERVKMTFDIGKDQYGSYQYTLTSYELLDPDKWDEYTDDLSGESVFQNHESEPSDFMIQECDNQFAEYLEYLEKYQ